MADFYTSSLSRTQGRSTWAIIFRHPRRADPTTGKEGLRVRQSLKTDDELEATKLRDDMNVLLSSPQLWDLGARDQALATLDPRVVDIFFYKLEGAEIDFLDLRESAIALPSSSEGEYRRALFLGTTGAGKTTLLRQVMGTDPVRERFPSTSAARTTVHETEVVLQAGKFEAVVTFFPVEDVREHLKECVSAGVLAAYRGDSPADQMRRLLSHVQQRFRFNYVLGDGPIKEAGDFDDDDTTGVPLSDRMIKTNAVLTRALVSLKEIAARHGTTLQIELGAQDEKDQRVVDELFEEELDSRTREDETFQLVVDELMDEIEERFSLLDEGKLQKTKVGWPLTWAWETSDREAFIRTLLKFSANHSSQFGSLLTPLVNGVRVRGPFRPAWSNEIPKLVLLDGEGLLHAGRVGSPMPLSVSRRIEMVDAVVLVDNAAQPMLDAPVSAMKEMVSSGSAQKLIFAFTHFDKVEGDNLPTPASRVNHVLASAENVLSAIGEDLGPFAERALRARLKSSRVFLADLNARIDETEPEGQRTTKQLSKLLEMIDVVVDRPKPTDSRPIYDRVELFQAVESAAQAFHNSWLPRLGITYKQGVTKEHWTRVKALARRLATGAADEYYNLRPVADLKLVLQQRLYVLLQNPSGWDGPEPTDDDKQHIYDLIAEELSRKLIQLASRRVRTERQLDWRAAFDLAGTGSTFRRARVIAERVYAQAAPLWDDQASPDRNLFRQEVANATKEAAENIGAKLQ